jgi:hypothetical protein
VRKWVSKPSWNEREFTLICCGIKPPGDQDGLVKAHIASINEVAEDIQRAIFVGDLSFVPVPGANHAERIYKDARHFKPVEALRWARSRPYNSFPGFKIVKADKVLHSNASVFEDIDPSDLPVELDAANLAFRALTNGYGEQSATPRNRLIDYLKNHFKDFKEEQIQRIATVANPDKSAGRKKSTKE